MDAPMLLPKDFFACWFGVFLALEEERETIMATELKQNARLLEQPSQAFEPDFIDVTDMANIERAVAAGAGAVDQYSPTGSDDLDELRVRTIITQALVAAKVDAAKLYAFLTIGCLVTVDNASRLTATQVTEWIKAVQDYRQRHSGHA
jgi:hypothetical protein